MSRLKLATLEQKPKKVIVGATWRDPAGITNDPAFQKILTRIRRCIENGAPLPSTFYSKGAGSRPDPLLQDHGIMHLHLGNWNTKELLWVVQYADRVVWLELSDHAPFSTRPPGTGLFNFHKVTITQTDAAVAAPSGQAGATGSTGTSPAVKIRLRPKENPAKKDD